jgi:riboflavin kinase/FMN adenylyltransferase
MTEKFTPKTIITVGAFDGVHRGHQAILKRLVNKAKEISAEPLVVSFWPHPSHVIGSKPLRLINTLEEKKYLIRSHGIDKLEIIPFTPDFSKLSALNFIKTYLIEQFSMKYFLVGYNHHFGNDRLGDINIIKQYGRELDFDVEKAGPVEINEEKISSTKIRQAITEGNVELANSYLGYPFFLSGIVSRGRMLGRTIGFPTANIQIDYDYKLLPRDGVYAVKVELDKKIYDGMLNIGHRPTVNSDKLLKTIEAHIIDFDEDIYGHPITVHFEKRIRDEIKFPDLDSLKKQLANDKLQVIKFFA